LLPPEVSDLTVVPGVNSAHLQPDHYILCAGSDRTQAICPILDILTRRSRLSNLPPASNGRPIPCVRGRFPIASLNQNPFGHIVLIDHAWKAWVWNAPQSGAFT
jgi:hypothetical protein